MITHQPGIPEPPGSAPRPRPVDWRLRLPFFYGWLIVAGIFVCLALSYTLWYSFPVFYVTLFQEFGWSRGPSAGVFSLFVVIWSLIGAVSGTLSDRLGPSRIVAVGVTIAALGLAASSRLTELWHYYLLYGLITAFGFSLCSWVPLVATITRWFYIRMGTAMGFGSAGIGGGIVVMVPLSQWLISQFGWRTAYLVLAVIIFSGIVPIALIVLRGSAAELGLPRDGAASRERALGPSGARRSAVVDPEWANRDWTVRTAARTGRFWALFFAMLLNSFGVQTVFVHEVAFLVDGGYDKMLVASIVGLLGLFSVAFKMGWGLVSDRIGRELAWTLGLASLLVGIGLLGVTRLVDFQPLLYLFAFTFALGYAVAGPMGPAVGADLFGGKRFGAIFGTLGFSNGIGASIGPWLAGYLFDLTGSYLLPFSFAAVATVGSAAIVWLAAPRKVRRVPGRC